MLKVAVIGTGGYAFQIIKHIWQVPEHLEMVAVTSNPNWKSDGLEPCKERGIAVYHEIDEMLTNLKGKCDAIFVPTPIYTHYQIAKKCVENGFDVFLEKPPTATIQDFDALAKVARKNKRRIAIGFQAIYSVIVQDLKKRICDGRFGRVNKIRSMALWPRDDAYYKRNNWAGKTKLNDNWILDGTINNPLAHVLANELYFASDQLEKMSQPVSVQAEFYHGHGIDSEDTSSLRVMTENDVEIIFNATLCPTDTVNPITVIECENAVIEYTNFVDAKITYKDAKKDRIVDNTVQRNVMLAHFAQNYHDQKPFAAEIEICRPFTLTVNCAFESAGSISSIPDSYVKRVESSDSVLTIVQNIDDYIKLAHEQGKLLSEINVPWAIKPEIFKVPENYCEFPSRDLEL